MHSIVKAWLKKVKEKLMTLAPGESEFSDSPGALVELIPKAKRIGIFNNHPLDPFFP